MREQMPAEEMAVRLGAAIDSTRAKQERNRELAARIADGRDTLPIDKVIEFARTLGESNLHVNGPRVLQILDELDRLRGIEQRAREVAAAPPGPHPGSHYVRAARHILGETDV